MKTIRDYRKMSNEELLKEKMQFTNQFRSKSALEVKQIIQKQCNKIDKVLEERK